MTNNHDKTAGEEFSEIDRLCQEVCARDVKIKDLWAKLNPDMTNAQYHEMCNMLWLELPEEYPDGGETVFTKIAHYASALRSDLEEARQDIETLKRSRNIIWCSKGHEILLSPSPVPDYPVLLMAKCGECGEQVRTNEAVRQNEDRLRCDREEARKERDRARQEFQVSGDGEPLWFITARFFHEVYDEKTRLRTEAKRLREALEKIKRDTRPLGRATKGQDIADDIYWIAHTARSPPTDQATTAEETET